VASVPNLSPLAPLWERAEDRRVLLLRTTPQGDELVSELRQKRRERMTELFNHLSEKEAEIVAQGLKIIVKVIETEEINPVHTENPL